MAAAEGRADAGVDPARRVYLVQGDDPSLLAQAVAGLVQRLVDAGIAEAGTVEEYGEPGQPDSLELSAVLLACRTPPFLTERRLVVVRDASGIDAAQQRELLAYLGDPLDTTVLVVGYHGRVPAAIGKAAAAHGATIAGQPGGGRARGDWVQARVRERGVRLDQAAQARLVEHLGEDLARLDGVLETLQATFGPGTALHESDLEPYLGEAGGVAPWDLTDALDEGDTAGALRALHRMLEAGDRHPLQVIALLHRHFGAMLRLDGGDVADEAAAALVTGLAAFPARKALRQTRRLGHERVGRAITLLAGADLDLRGRAGLPETLVMELLVARLAQLARLSGRAARTRV